MKNILTLCLFTLFAMSCGGSKTVRQSKKVIKGDWVLSQVTHNQKGNYKIALLDDATQDCFEGSVWKFVPNNNSGNYSLSNTNCGDQARYFVFTIKEIDKTTGLYNFLLKPTNYKGKSQTNHGFRMSLTQLSDTNMQWQQTINVDGKPFTLNMNFLKQ